VNPIDGIKPLNRVKQINKDVLANPIALSGLLPQEKENFFHLPLQKNHLFLGFTPILSFLLGPYRFRFHGKDGKGFAEPSGGRSLRLRLRKVHEEMHLNE
jgi:hypothetical protein